uniref:coiled-coil domain-containing protein 158-like isoform X2 n=1 Tax=Fragaria vesca subsp. vesca TaxID=101020 RepID=UPI0005C8CCD4|nr:PREDICTED: coiled-coil domain-containing protein 158-like isoform X2 [Fragaria vesca subsp. vesca]
MSKLVYPKLSRREIVTILVEAQIIAISEQDLLHPNPDLISDLYTRVLTTFYFLPEDDEQVDFDSLELLENPDVHDMSSQRVRLCSTLKQVMALLDCPKKFTLADLLRPDPNRTEETKIDLVAKVVDQLTHLQNEHISCEGQVSQWNAEITHYNETKEKELPLVEEVDSKVKELRQTISDLNLEQVKLRTSIRKLKEKTAEMDKEISDADFDLLKSDSERQELRSKIVHSPDKLQRALAEKKLIKENATSDEMLAMQSLKEKTTVDEVYTKVSKKLKKHLAQMHSIQEQVNSAKSTIKEHRALEEKKSHDEVLSKVLQDEQLKQQAKVKELNDLKKKLEKEKYLKFEEASKKLSNVELEVESRSCVLEARKKNVEAARAEANSITAKIAAVRKSGATDQQQLARRSEDIIKEFHQYLYSIGVLLQC